jgi:hypothetical protein
MDPILFPTKPKPMRARGQADLFDAPAAGEPTSRRRDTIGAASGRAAIAPVADTAREQVYRAIAAHGPVSGAALEELPELAHLGSSTARKRAIELREAGRVRGHPMVCRLTKRHVEHFEVIP